MTAIICLARISQKIDMTTVTRTSRYRPPDAAEDADKEIFAMEEAGWRVRQIIPYRYDLYVIFERDKD